MKTNTSIWSSLRNPVYLRVWLALVVSGCCVTAQDTAATWAMNSMGASALLLSMMATASTLPFFLFTLPAGALGDLLDRRRLLQVFSGWLSVSAGLLAVCALLNKLTPEIVLMGVFLLGIGFAFQAPVSSAAIPEIVGKEDLPSATALGGVQMNVSGIIGPALGGLLIPLIGVGGVFWLNAAAFVVVLLAVSSWPRKSARLDAHLESFADSVIGAIRYMKYAPGVRVLLLRNLLFGILIGATPALLPVVGLKALHFDSLHLGFVFTCMGIGSLTGAIVILEPARKRLKPNQMTVLTGVVLAVSYALMAVVRNPQIFLLVAAIAGAAWTISASELWVAGQRVIPDWIRGRLNATHMMVSQGGVSLAGILWGTLATTLGIQWALLSASIMGIISALAAKRLSIDFSALVNLDPHPLPALGPLSYLPEPSDGPITTAMEIEVAPENHVRFFGLMTQLRLVFLRNGAFNARLDQDMANPNRFRLYSMVRSWTEFQRLGQRITRDEHALWAELWTLHVGPDAPSAKRYLGIQHWTAPDTLSSRLKPVSEVMRQAQARSQESASGS
ncbi:MAG: MFS transporter [Verrucomicrobia bacterium]|nr:MFS transporter [Verrucomicrobiota bacterium]